MNNLPQAGEIELRHYPTHTGVIRQTLNARDDVGNDASADVRYTLFGVPSLNGLEIDKCRFGKPDTGGHALFETEPGFGLM